MSNYRYTRDWENQQKRLFTEYWVNKMKKGNYTIVETRDKDGKLVSIKMSPVPHKSLIEKWQDMCQENFGAYLLTIGGLTGIIALIGMLF